jgi:PAS domain S-box-containing protein
MTKRGRSAAPEAPAAWDPGVRAVLDSMPDVVYTLDLEGRFTYLNPRAYEVFGYDPVSESFLGREVMDILAPGDTAPAIGAIRRRAETPRDRQVFRVEARHKDGSPIPLEIHGSAVLQDGRIVGRVGICRVLDAHARADGATGLGTPVDVLQEDRMRIARGLRDAIAQIVFGVTAERDASESFLSDVKRATRADLARRLRLDDVDLEILRLVAAGASNREIGVAVHLSPAAIKDRVRRLMDRLGARRRAELAAHALRLGVA